MGRRIDPEREAALRPLRIAQAQEQGRAEGQAAHLVDRRGNQLTVADIAAAQAGYDAMGDLVHEIEQARTTARLDTMRERILTEHQAQQEIHGVWDRAQQALTEAASQPDDGGVPWVRLLPSDLRAVLAVVPEQYRRAPAVKPPTPLERFATPEALEHWRWAEKHRGAAGPGCACPLCGVMSRLSAATPLETP